MCEGDFFSPAFFRKKAEENSLGLDFPLVGSFLKLSVAFKKNRACFLEHGGVFFEKPKESDRIGFVLKSLLCPKEDILSFAQNLFCLPISFVGRVERGKEEVQLTRNLKLV